MHSTYLHTVCYTTPVLDDGGRVAFALERMTYLSRRYRLTARGAERIIRREIDPRACVVSMSVVGDAR